MSDREDEPSPVPASPHSEATAAAATAAVSPAAEQAEPAAESPAAAATAAAPPPPYPGFLPRASSRFAHAPELLLFALDLSREAALPATRNPPAASPETAGACTSSSSAPPLVPTRFDALASVALLVARAKGAVAGRHRFGLIACRGGQLAEFVPGSICADAAQLESALSRLRDEALSSGDNDDNAPFDFSSLADAAAVGASSSSSSSSSPSLVRVVLLYTRSRAPPPLPLSREQALDALWRCRLSLPSLHVDVLYAYDPSSSAPASSDAPSTSSTTPQQVFSRLEQNVDALSAAAPHALTFGSSSSAAARDAARRNHGYVLDVSVFAPRRLMGAACQLVSHPLQRPALARPPQPPDLAKARSVPLPSEASNRKKAQQRQLEEEQRRQRELLEDQQEQQQQEDEDGRDEWGLPLPPPPAAGTAAADPSPPAAPPPPPLLVDITDQMQRVGVVSSFPVMASGHETDGEGSGLGDDGGGQLSPLSTAAPLPLVAVPSPPPVPLSPPPPPAPPAV